MFDQELRAVLVREHIAQLHEEKVATEPRARARRALGELMIRFGDRLAREPQRPCREVSSRA